MPMTYTAQMMERQHEQDMFWKFMEDVKRVIQKPIIDLHKEVKDLLDELAVVKDQKTDGCSQELKEKKCPSCLPKVLTVSLVMGLILLFNVTSRLVTCHFMTCITERNLNKYS